MEGRGNRTTLSVGTDTTITVLFVLLGLVLWYGSRSVVESRFVQFALLIGVGVIIPTLLIELRQDN